MNRLVSDSHHTVKNVFTNVFDFFVKKQTNRKAATVYTTVKTVFQCYL